MGTIGIVHTTFAVLALCLGGVVVGMRKGTRVHRTIGHLYVSSLLGVNVTAFFLYGLFGRMGPFHVFAIVSAVTLLLGIVPAVTRRPREAWLGRHAIFMAWSYVGLLAAAGAETAVRVPGVPFFGGVLAASIGIPLIGAYVIHGRRSARIATAMRRAERTVPAGRSAAAAVILIALAAPAEACQAPALTAQRDSAARLVDRGVILHDVARLGEAQRLFERLHEQQPDDGLTLAWLGYALYRLSEMMEESTSGRPAEQLRDSATRVLKRSLESAPLPETYALLATLTGRSMAGSTWRAIFSSGRWQRELELAQRLGPQNPRVLLLRGMNLFHAPARYGGVGEALRCFEAAVAAFAQDAPQPGHPAWGRAEAHAWLGRARARSNNAAGAAEAYRAALALEPDYAWVRDVLLPRLDRPALPPSSHSGHVRLWHTASHPWTAERGRPALRLR